MTEPRSVLDIDPENLTPGMRQYHEAKTAHPDCLIMLRMGDFYEMFYEDAIVASRELEITLTARGKGEKRAPLAGIPFHALEPYLGKLVKKGYKVAIIEQLEDPKKAKGLVKRGLVRIVTPGTVIESTILEEKENNYLAAATVSGDQFALAWCDISTGEFSATIHAQENALLHDIVRLRPRECLVPTSLLVNKEFIQHLKGQGCYVNTLDDYFFALEKSEQLLQQQFHLSSLQSLGIERNSRMICAAGALLHYIIDTQKNSAAHIKTLTVRSNQQTMLLDASTFRNLEIVQNLRDGSLRGTLLSVLDHTNSAAGSRLLKKWLREPLLDQQMIEQRLEAIENLSQEMMTREEIRSVLKEISDIERLIGRVQYGTATPRDLVSLRQSLGLLPRIQQLVQKFSGELLQLVASLPMLQPLRDLLQDALRDDPPVTIREGGMIKPQFHPELAELAALRANARRFLQEIEEQERVKTGISTLKIGYTKVFGYFIEVTKKNMSLVPASYIRKQTTAQGERYITEELKKIEEKILTAEEKMVELEFQIYQDILRRLTAQTQEFQEIARKLAMLDVLCSLAKVAVEYGYRRPFFVKENSISMKKARHPVVERVEPRFISNDLSLADGEMMIITGPNMAGKSTIMRQVALNILLAQIGSFVPAEEMILGIVDRIFTRVGAADDISSGQSTFMVEMTETAAILNNATERSLLILDEIGRGTSTFDGVSIAWSVAEHIHNQIKAKTLFATHYHVMNKLAEKFPRMRNYNIAVKEEKGEVIFLRKLVVGGTDQSYGIHVAQVAGLPSQVISRAREIQQLLEQDDDMMRKIKAKKLEEQKSLASFSTTN
ncbi:DNA mismatch repair protein MutS [Candidatus Woesearchaeota archaeon]|nr:DNA mismatch repair protein MutS [Candidatus Woesearchaeota archaeon]